MCSGAEHQTSNSPEKFSQYPHKLFRVEILCIMALEKDFLTPFRSNFTTYSVVMYYARIDFYLLRKRLIKSYYIKTSKWTLFVLFKQQFVYFLPERIRLYDSEVRTYIVCTQLKIKKMILKINFDTLCKKPMIMCINLFKTQLICHIPKQTEQIQ